MTDIVSRECRFVQHIPATRANKDTHMVKEIIHYSDGTSKKNLRLIEDFKRPFWVTKEHKRNHKQKKESEYLDNLLEGKATESDLGRAAATKLGPRYNGIRDLFSVKPSPYLYGTDVNSRTYIKHLYQNKYPDKITPYEVCILDIEVDTLTNTIIIVTIATNSKSHTIITKPYLSNICSKQNITDIEATIIPKLEYLYNQYIPKTKISGYIKPTYQIVDNELDLVKVIMAKLHNWKPDIVSGWNIGYDLGKMLNVLEKNNIPVESIMCDPGLPPALRKFKFIPGRSKTAKGSPINPEERWPVVRATSSFCWLDAMSAHRFIRVGGKAVPGGYSLDNVLKNELGDKLGKLKFKDSAASKTKGIDWHRYMVANMPLEYITYNQWDVISILEMDSKTLDLSTVLPMLSGVSNFDVFNSGPKRIIDALHFFYLDNKRVLSTHNPRGDDKDLLGLGGWINILPSCRVSEKGIPILKEGGPDTNIRMYVSDSDLE